MPEPVIPPIPTPPVRFQKPDVVFAALADPARRRILCALALGVPRTASGLTSASQRRLDATLKHLKALRNAGLVEQFENSQDKRRQLYRLANIATVTRTAAGTEIDFGCCVVRL